MYTCILSGLGNKNDFHLSSEVIHYGPSPPQKKKKHIDEVQAYQVFLCHASFVVQGWCPNFELIPLKLACLLKEELRIS